MNQGDQTLECLFDLDGERFVVDDVRGYWVRIEARKTQPTEDRPAGIRYSLTLHDRANQRVLGFDNAHAIEYDKKTNIPAKRQHDHWHGDSTDKGRPYFYENAAKLLEDFFREVDKYLARHR